MTSGLGISIGTVNVVSARVGEHDNRPAVRTRRTAVGFDDRGSARLGGITRFSTAVSEFADLGRNPESVYVDGRIWSPPTIFASVVQGLVAAEPATGVVATHPAGYSAKQLDLLRQSLDLAGVGHVQLVPEPVAAAHWLDTEHGPLDTGFVLVYDLGGNSLDIAVVRTGADWPDHPVVGKPVRSYDFGGRPLGALIARCAGDRAIGPAEPGTGSVSLMSFVDPEGLRREHIRDSLEVVRGAVRSAGVALSDISRILVVGGAARPAQVAETLAELGLPVMIAADSAQCVALGAAAMAADNVPSAASSQAGHAPIFSGAAVFSAVAMSAATILGNGAADTVVPDPDRMPLQTPGAVLYEIHGEAQVERSGTGWSVSYAPLNTGPSIAPAGVSRPYGPPMPGAVPAPAESGSDRGGDRAGSHTSPRDRHVDNGSRYSDPARFRNPIPFDRPDLPVRTAPAKPETPGTELPDGPDPDDMPVIDPPGGQPGEETAEPEHGTDNGTGGVPGLPDLGSPRVPEVPGGSWSGGAESPGGNWSAPGSGWSAPGSGWTAPGGSGETSTPESGNDGSDAGNSDGPGAGSPGSPGGFGTGNTGGYGAGDSGGYGAGNSGGFGAGDSGGFGSGGSGAGDSGGFGGGGFGGSDSRPGGSSRGGSDSSGGSNSNSGGFGGFGGGHSTGRGGSDSGGSDSSKGSKSRGSDSGGSSSSGSDGGSSRSKGSRGKSSGGKSSGGGSDN